MLTHFAFLYFGQMLWCQLEFFFAFVNSYSLLFLKFHKISRSDVFACVCVYVNFKPFFDALDQVLDYRTFHSCYAPQVASDTGYQVVGQNVESVVVAFHQRLAVRLVVVLDEQDAAQRPQDAAVPQDADIEAAGPCEGAVVDKGVDT